MGWQRPFLAAPIRVPVAVMMVVLAGCSVAPSVPPPADERPLAWPAAPSPSRTEPPPPRVVQPRPAPPAASSSSRSVFTAPSASGGTAVVALLDEADRYAQTGRPERAVATLERALRIEPRNAQLWHRLARVRFQQGQFEQVVNLAAKSNSLAGNDTRLRAANWRLIGTARQRLGDESGAQKAFVKARQYQP